MITNPTAPSKYRFFTRLGNWSEEWELEEVRKREYLRRKANRTSFMLYNAKTQGFLGAFLTSR